VQDSAELSNTGTSISSLICLYSYTPSTSNIRAVTKRCKDTRFPYSLAGKWHLTAGFTWNVDSGGRAT